jgi:hypothetical protein
VSEFRKALLAMADREGFAVQFSRDALAAADENDPVIQQESGQGAQLPPASDCKGVTLWDDDTIVVRDDMPTSEQNFTLAHELAHVWDRNHGTRQDNYPSEEVLAEETAEYVAERFGAGEPDDVREYLYGSADNPNNVGWLAHVDYAMAGTPLDQLMRLAEDDASAIMRELDR